MITIEVAYASTSGQQYLIPVTLAEPCTAEQAILQSGICERCLEIDLRKNKIGVFSKPISLDYLLHNHDRLEIYRPLQIDPKQARRLRAK